MNLLSELKSIPGSTGYRKRVGRGRGSGLGQTSGKGHKGQKARSGGRVRRGFEGGQMPLHRRLPKFGFNNIFRVEYNIVNLSQIADFKTDVNPETLRRAGLVRRAGPIKVLGLGKLQKPLKVVVHHFSAKAKEAILAVGGTAEVMK